MKLTTIAVAALLTSAATDDAAIESRTEYKILCAYKSIVVPIDRGPKLSACKQDLAKIPAADLDAEREKFWLYWNSSQEAVAVSVVSKYATFRERKEGDRSALRGWGSPPKSNTPVYE